MKLTTIHNVYFIGIGGIGMSALARWFHVNNYTVAGCDRIETSITKSLSELGIQIHFEDNEVNIGKEFKRKENTLIVYTPAIPLGHKELNYFKNKGFQIKKRAEVLGTYYERY